MHTEQAIDNLMRRYLQKCQQQTGQQPTVSFDPPWPSPCTDALEQTDESRLVWEPQFRGNTTLFDDLEHGLECAFPESLIAFYGRYWSNGICVDFEDIELQLIQIWNDEDEEQLKNNMLGHCFARRKGRLPLDFFIASMEGPDIATIQHDSGEIWLGRPGKVLHRKLANSLSEFLDVCQPNLEPYD